MNARASLITVLFLASLWAGASLAEGEPLLRFDSGALHIERPEGNEPARPSIAGQPMGKPLPLQFDARDLGISTPLPAIDNARAFCKAFDPTWEPLRWRWYARERRFKPVCAKPRRWAA